MSYQWIFTHDYSKQVKEVPAPTSPIIKEATGSFNLEYFLKITKGWVPPDPQYRQICMYLAGIKFDANVAGKLCNEAWNYTSNETHNFVKNYQNTDVSKATIIRLAKLHAVCEWDVHTLFPKTPYKYYSEYTKFAVREGGVWEVAEVDRFIQDVFFYITSAKKFVFRNIQKHTDKQRNEFSLIETYLQDKAPFTGSDTMYVDIAYCEDELMKLLDKHYKKDAVGLAIKKERLTHITSKVERIKTLTDTLKPSQKLMLLGQLAGEVHKKCYIKRYQSITFVPYLYKDPCDSGTFNIFSGFDLLSYTPTVCVDITKTYIWAWLWDCFAFKQQKVMDWNLNFLAWKLQNPAIRSERILVLLSKEMGNGKSTYFHLLKCIFSSAACAFWENLDSFQDPFDYPTANKMFQFIDDISMATKPQCQRLNSRSTLTEKRFNQKHEKKVKLPVFDEIVITSNDRNPLYCDAHDRRQCYLKISDAHTMDKEFFKNVYPEFKNQNIRHAFFIFLAERKLGDWTPCPSNDPWPEEQMNQKAANMKKSYEFILDFFSEDCWSTKYQTYTGAEWTDDYEVKELQKRKLIQDQIAVEKSEIQIRVTECRLYELFKCWIKETKPSVRPLFKKTFMADLEDLGIFGGTRLRINDKKCKCVDIYHRVVKQHINRLYPGFNMGSWFQEI